MSPDLEIAQYLTAKICHDLAGTLGAINSGVDFLEVNNEEMRKKAIDLVKSSSLQSISRLNFLRYAYGIAKVPGEANLDEIKNLVEGYLHGTKVSLDFYEKFFHLPGVYISANTGKLVTCLILQAYSCLIYGGVIEIKIIPEEPNATFVIMAKGSNLKYDEEKHEILNGNLNQYQISTSNVTSFYIGKLMQELKHSLSVSRSLDKIEYSLILAK